MENASKGSIICSKTNIVRIAIDKIVIGNEKDHKTREEERIVEREEKEEKRKEITGGLCCEVY